MQLFFTRAWISIYYFFQFSKSLTSSSASSSSTSSTNSISISTSFSSSSFSNRSTSSQALPISNCSPANSYIDSLDTDSALSNANYPSPQPSTFFSSPPLLLTKNGELLYLQVPLKRQLLFWKKCTKAPRLQQ